MHVWTVANQKGGVGKTTTTATLAGLLAERAERVLMIDLDPHGSLTSYFGLDPDEVQCSLYTLFEAALDARKVSPEKLVRATRFERLGLLPAATALATLDRQLGRRGGMGLVLLRALESLEARFDHVLLDCSPALGVLTVNALAACTHLIIPVQTEFLALKGLERMLRTLEMIMRSRGRAVPYTIVPTFYDRRVRASIDCLAVLRERYAGRVWGSVIPVDARFREASRVGAPLSALAPGARGAQAYAALLDALTGQAEPGRRAAV